MAQNRSNAVMATRVEASDSLDDFPTPPWATQPVIWIPPCRKKLEQANDYDQASLPTA